jgi:hypothetical protein
MTCSVPEQDGRICHVHSLALRTEIGERLRTSLAREPVAPSAALLRLVTRLRDQPPVLER